MIETPGVLRGEEFVPLQELNERGLRGANAFHASGVGPGDAVALLLRNDHAFLEVTLALQASGVTPVPVNWHGSPDEVAFVIEDSGAKALVAHADLLEPVAARLDPQLCVRVVETPQDIGDAYSIRKESRSVADGHVEWSAWIQQFDASITASDSAPNAMVYTSGTTGRPKGVRAEPVDPEDPKVVAAITEMLIAQGVAPGMRTVVTGPLYHAMPNNYAVAAVKLGGFVVLQPRFDAEDLLRTIEEQHITHLCLVPVMFVRLLRLPEDIRRRYDLSSLQSVLHGAAPCAPDVKRAVIDWWGPIIREQYGSTEATLVASCDSEEWLAHPGTVGRPPSYVELRVLDDDGRDLPVGEIGELYSRATGMPAFTYQNRPDDRRAIERDGFITSGDVGYVDADGFVYICDRKRDMVISGGVNIYPIEIENSILKMDGVRDVAVFGIPDDEYGEALAAAVEAEAGAAIAAEDIQNYVRSELAGFKVPRLVEFHERLPREDSGKVFKRKLRAPYWERVGRNI